MTRARKACLIQCGFGTVEKHFYDEKVPVAMVLDAFGAVVTAILVAAFGLLILGVLSEKQKENTLNLVRHGFLSAAATAVTLILASWLMVPFFSRIISFAVAASLGEFPIMWIHAVLGAVTLGLGIVMIALWLRSPLSELGCSKAWKLMKPTLAVWAAAITLGAFIHFYGLA